MKMTLERLRQLRISGDDPWQFQCGFNKMVDFCVWTLQIDGLRVPPFDAHKDSSRMLRASGVTAASWCAWASRVAALQPGGSASPRSVWHVPPILDPSAAWLGASAAGVWLHDLWSAYAAVVHQRQACARSLLLSEPYHGLESVLRPYQGSLPALHVHLVAYLSLTVHAIPPCALVVGLPAEGISRADFRTALVRGATRLAINARPSFGARIPAENLLAKRMAAHTYARGI